MCFSDIITIKLSLSLILIWLLLFSSTLPLTITLVSLFSSGTMLLNLVNPFFLMKKEYGEDFNANVQENFFLYLMELIVPATVQGNVGKDSIESFLLSKSKSIFIPSGTFDTLLIFSAELEGAS